MGQPRKKKRKSLPAEFSDDKFTSIHVPASTVDDLILVGISEAIGGPPAAALAVAYQVLSSPNVAAASTTLANITTGANNLLQILKLILDFKGPNELDAIERIAAALGNPSQAYRNQQVTIGDHQTTLIRTLFKPGNPNANPPIPDEPFIDLFAEKKKLKTLAIRVTNYPEIYTLRKTTGNETLAMKLGHVFWKKDGNYIGSKQWIDTLHFISIAPHVECTGHDMYLYPGVVAQVTEGEIGIPW